MKKVFATVLSVCLVFALCISSFAATLDTSAISGITDEVKKIVSSISTTSSDADLKAAAEKVISTIQGAGAKTKAEVIAAADKLYESGAISEDVYNEIYKLISTDAYDVSSSSVDETIAKIKAIVNDSTMSNQDKATAIANLLSGYSSSQVKTILDTLHTAGIINDDLYNKISDALNSVSTTSSSGSTATTSSSSSATSGITDFISGLLKTLGIGGGSSSTTTTTAKSSSSSSSSSSSFQGSTAKTGDYAIASVSAVALAAGIVLVLTKKKK